MEDIQNNTISFFGEDPMKNLYKFDGIVKEAGNNIENSIDLKSFIPRGSTVKNSEDVYAIVMYTGKDTKLSLNEGKYNFKISDL